MQTSTRINPLVRRWLIGLAGSWICVWIAGPWLVNSILIRSYDPALGVVMLRDADVIRWRSEGWATTRIGPHGLPGWAPNGASERIVIWGDSQVEGLCVDDNDKLHRRVVQIAQHKHHRLIDCVPIGRSGTDAADWSRLTARADELWHPIAHVWIVTELEDLRALVEEAGSSPAVDRWQAESPPWVQAAKRVHAEAAFQAARNLVFDPDSGGLRSLRFTLGRVAPGEQRTLRGADGTGHSHRWQRVQSQLVEINRQLDDRLLLLYAPAVPRIMDDVVSEHPDDPQWNQLQLALVGAGVPTIDLRQTFIDQWTEHGEFARGFHNGSPSYGHLNRVGNRLIAAAICAHIFKAQSAAGGQETGEVVP